jgi:hypothetical protein
MFEEQEQKNRTELLKLIDEATQPLDIHHLSQKLGLAWWSTYRLVTSLFLEEVQQHPEIMAKLSFVCLKSTKSLVVMPNRLLPQTHEVEANE